MQFVSCSQNYSGFTCPLGHTLTGMKRAKQIDAPPLIQKKILETQDISILIGFNTNHVHEHIAVTIATQCS